MQEQNFCYNSENSPSVANIFLELKFEKKKGGGGGGGGGPFSFFAPLHKPL